MPRRGSAGPGSPGSRAAAPPPGARWRAAERSVESEKYVAVSEPRVMVGPGCRSTTPGGNTRPGPRRRGRAIYSSRRGDIRGGRVRAPCRGRRGGSGRRPAALPGRGRLWAGAEGAAPAARVSVARGTGLADRGAGWRFEQGGKTQAANAINRSLFRFSPGEAGGCSTAPGGVRALHA